MTDIVSKFNGIDSRFQTISNNISELELEIAEKQDKEETLYFTDSKIFKRCGLAWKDKNNLYESWPNGGVQADGNDIIIIYNSRYSHVDRTLSSDIIMRKKCELDDWDEKKIILQHDGTNSYANPSWCILNNGDYFMVCYVETAETLTPQKFPFKMFKSTDKGETWSDLGFVKVNNEIITDECMMTLFCTSTGKLISFVGGTNNLKFVASDDNGQTWRFVGDAFTKALEATFYEATTGHIYAILRSQNSNPYFIKLNAQLTEYEILYSGNTFKFPVVWNPVGLKTYKDKIVIIGGSRTPDRTGRYVLYETITTE